MNEQMLALDIIEALRGGQPPKRGFRRYSVGSEDLIEGIKTQHLAHISGRGVFRFVSGDPGRGKTHLFRLIRETALDYGCLVSNVELNAADTPFNQFEKVFSSIVRNIYTPALYSEDDDSNDGFERVLKEALNYLITGNKGNDKVTTISETQLLQAIEGLQQYKSIITLDFRKMVQHYWRTYVPAGGFHTTELSDKRDELLQWFQGQGDGKVFKKSFDINTMVTGKNAQDMLKSLSGFVRLAGYSGLVILFDEGARFYELMTKSERKRARENLFGLINNVMNLDGLYLLYATTPEFFTAKEYGVMRDRALAGRISLPKDVPPQALHKTWNLNALPADLDHYKKAAGKIRVLYAEAHPDCKTELPSEEEIDRCVETLEEDHADNEGVSLWRVMVLILIRHLDGYYEGRPRPIEKVREEVMESIREGDIR